MKSGSVFNPAPNPGTCVCVCVCARARVSVRVNLFLCTGNYSAREGVGGAAAKAPAGADASLTADDKDGDLPAKMECTICLCGMKKPAVTKCGSLSASITGCEIVNQVRWVFLIGTDFSPAPGQVICSATYASAIGSRMGPGLSCYFLASSSHFLHASNLPMH